MFEFEKENQDQRAEFANKVCQLLIDKYHGDFEKASGELKNLREHFEENVRNVYELVDNQIPLFALYELMQGGKDNYGITWEEYKEAIERTKLACKEFYNCA